MTSQGRYASVRNIGHLTAFCGPRVIPPGEVDRLAPGEVLQLGTIALDLARSPRPRCWPRVVALVLACAVCAGWASTMQPPPAPRSPFDLKRARSEKHPAALSLFAEVRLAVARGDRAERVALTRPFATWCSQARRTMVSKSTTATSSTMWPPASSAIDQSGNFSARTVAMPARGSASYYQGNISSLEAHKPERQGLLIPSRQWPGLHSSSPARDISLVGRQSTNDG